MNIKLLSVIIVSLSVLAQVWGGEVRGKLNFSDGSVATGEVCVGIVNDPQSPYLSALMDVLASQKGVKTDASGNYVIQNVSEGVAVMVVADVNGQSSPSRIAQMTVQAGEVKLGVNFSFVKITESAANLKGKVTINGAGPAEEIGGTIVLVSSDNSQAAMAYFGVVDEGAYEFENVPPGNYTLTAGAPVAPNSQTVGMASASVVVSAAGITTANLNIQIP